MGFLKMGFFVILFFTSVLTYVNCTPVIQTQESLRTEAETHKDTLETQTESVEKTVPESVIETKEQSFNFGLIPPFDWRRFGGFGRIGSQIGQQIPGEGDSGHFNNFKSRIGQDFGIIGNRKKRSPDPQFGNFGYQNPQFGNYGSQNPRFSNYGSQIGQQVDRSTNIDLGLNNLNLSGLGVQTVDRAANHVDRILGRFLGRKKRSPLTYYQYLDLIKKGHSFCCGVRLSDEDQSSNRSSLL